MTLKIVRLLAVAALGAIAGVVALGFADAAGTVGPGRLEVRATWERGGATDVLFPPLGRLRADTHDAPLQVRAELQELDLESLQQSLDQPRPDEVLREQVADDLPNLLRTFAIRAALFAFVAGAIAGALVPGRGILTALVAGSSGVLAVGALLGLAWNSFEPTAFDEPTFSGTLERAPAVIEAVQRNVDDLDEIRDRVDTVADQLAALYRVATDPPAGPTDDDVRILHVSDIHSNPLGLEIVADLADRFEVAAVLDTGDITSFGLPVESRVGELVAQVDAPYYYVPGNHDSLANQRAIDAVENVTLVDGDVVDIDGVRILGVADPTFTATNEIDSDEAAAARLDAAPDVARRVRRTRPDVLAVHDARLATESYGDVPLVVAGHTHVTRSTDEDGTRILTVGSTGATGLGAFTVDLDLRYEAQVLHFRDGALVIVDVISLDGLSGSYELRRTIIDPDDAEDPPDDAPEDASGDPVNESVGTLRDHDGSRAPVRPVLRRLRDR
ncbi:MAG TPA: metallophosphoesterase [Acidimicrobiia bacterium]|nr:metallophosphoesterase [Acidimicrobiia bacterium]